MGRMGIVDEIDVRDAPLRGATPLQALNRVLTLAFRIRGRASRSEYWWWMLAQAAVSLLLLAVVPATVGHDSRSVIVSLAGPIAPFTLLQVPEPVGDTPLIVTSATILYMVLGIATVIPSITVAVRRPHDANFSGLWLLIAGIPFGQFALLLMLLRPSRADGERFDC